MEGVCGAVMMSLELESQTTSDETTLGCLSTTQHSDHVHFYISALIGKEVVTIQSAKLK